MPLDTNCIDRTVVSGVSGRRSKIQGYSKKSKRRYREYLRNTSHLWSHEIQQSEGKSGQRKMVKSLIFDYPYIIRGNLCDDIVFQLLARNPS